MKVTFNVPGDPQGKGRARIVKIGGFSRMATPAKTVAYEGLIALAARQAMRGADPFTGPVQVSMTIAHSVPASWSRVKREAALAGAIRPTVKPDVDNVLKAVGDGGNGVLWADDRQIVAVVVSRLYAMTPGVTVTVEDLGVGRTPSRCATIPDHAQTVAG